ncbi:MAG: hypothetical protein IT260_07790 [Saprospiraceae bacterium]|nr:hypothetical protein [Saprospiraceae bacterium]
MVIIWRGMGLLVPVLYILAYVLVSWAIGTFDLDIDPDITNLKFLSWWMLAGGLMTWLLGKKINAPGPEGLPGNRHHLFFIPVQYWAIVAAVIVLLLGSSVQKKFAYVAEIYRQSRLEFFSLQDTCLERLAHPREGDYYYFEFDIRMGDMGKDKDAVWRGGGTMFFKLVASSETQVQLLAPVAHYGTLDPIRGPEDYAQYFPDSLPDTQSRVFWVNKAKIKKTVSMNFHKQRSFEGYQIPEFNKSGIKFRLKEIKRF